MSTSIRTLETNLYRSVSTVLTGCTLSNENKKIINGQSYASAVTPSKGYTLDNATVQITMGDVNASAYYYKNGIIAIPSVTGNIEISITAQTSINLFDKSGCTINKRYSGGTNEVTANGYYISDYLPVTPGQKVTLTGVVNSTSDKICFYNSSKAALSVAYIYTSKVGSGSNTATLFTGDAINGYVNTIGYTWTGLADIVAASYYNEIAYIRINQQVSSSALTSTDEVPDHTFM